MSVKKTTIGRLVIMAVLVWAQERTREELIIRALSRQDEGLAIKDMLDDPLCWGGIL